MSSVTFASSSALFSENLEARQLILNILASSTSQALFTALDLAKDSQELYLLVFSKASPEQMADWIRTNTEGQWSRFKEMIGSWIETQILYFDLRQSHLGELEQRIDQIRGLADKIGFNQEEIREWMYQNLSEQFYSLYFERDSEPLSEMKPVPTVLGQFERCVDKIPGFVERECLWLDCLIKYASQGAFDDADRILQQIQDPARRRPALECLSHQTLIQTHNLEETMKYERQIQGQEMLKDPHSLNQAMLDLFLQKVQSLDLRQAFQKACTEIPLPEIREWICGEILVQKTLLNPKRIRKVFKTHPDLHAELKRGFLFWAQKFIQTVERSVLKDTFFTRPDPLLRHLAILSELSQQLVRLPLQLEDTEAIQGTAGYIALAPLSLLGMELQKQLSEAIHPILCGSPAKKGFLQLFKKQNNLLFYADDCIALAQYSPFQKERDFLFQQILVFLLDEGGFAKAESVLDLILDPAIRTDCIARFAMHCGKRSFDPSDEAKTLRKQADRWARLFAESQHPQKWDFLLHVVTDSINEIRDEEDRLEKLDFLRWVLSLFKKWPEENRAIKKLFEWFLFQLSYFPQADREVQQAIEGIKNPCLRRIYVSLFWGRLNPDTTDASLHRWFLDEFKKFDDPEDRKSLLQQLQGKISLLAQGWYGESQEAYRTLLKDIESLLKAGDGPSLKKQRK